ncbi:aminotransferase class I/II-fold pyridoxal phosphate-dependent enzyme [Agromyces sp. SYSU K20354]|uniref:aminotransferase class I/II-fold pyridoxal phosphate-dependent enzyme n=1 Tax=Agromyces cavernae TaxID=2898659 RepID=UPI001E2B42E2|nr:aminotransferase class I/II-fold pyridoxal phosphate-dependent enzyme [Agromyces cavernae]MCD2443288.1 aminotransferase class I/II-fold pyridoxal phosphate-dependent enzyme [Agromyces cavernae]
MDDRLTSDRVATVAAATPFQLLYEFYRLSGYEQRRHEPGVLDFTFGDPHDPPSEAYVEILREALIPQHELWFAYNFGDAKAIEAATDSLRRHIDLPFEPDDVHLTTGGFAAISIALKIVGDPGDEVVYSLPPWFLYEPLVLEAGLVPVKVSIDRQTLDLDLDAIAAAITPRTRIVIVNSPNNPTGRIYPPATLERLAKILDEASERNGRRIFLISDEPYNRIVYDGARFRSPLEFYPWSFLAYSYGKTLLSPGERLGYLAVSPTMPGHEQFRDAIEAVQISGGWLFPNSSMQYGLPRLEQLAFDIELFQRKRDTMVAALREIGYNLTVPEGTFYLFPESPLADDVAFTQALDREGVLVLPGRMFETPGFFRISLTATMETIEAGIPRFAAAFRAVEARNAEAGRAAAPTG